MKSVYFGEHHHRHRERVRAFLQEHVLPQADEWEAQRGIPREAWRRLGEAGLLEHHQRIDPEQAGPDIFHSVITCEELGRTGYAGVRAAVALHAFMALPYLAEYGSADLKDRYLGPARAGRRVAGLGLTEPQAGSDLGGLELRAEACGEHYELSGCKRYVINSTVADFFIVAGRTGEGEPGQGRGRGGGLSLFVVDADTPGLERRPLDMLGWHAADTGELVLDRVRVPRGNLIGRERQGFMVLMKNLQLERLAVACLAIGGIDGCLDETWAQLRAREVGGRPLARVPVLRDQLAAIVAKNECARQLAYHAAWTLGRGQLGAAECSMAKLVATELAASAVQECARLHGARGYHGDAAVARMYRDATVSTIGAGASEVMRELIAQLTLDEAGWRRKPTLVTRSPRSEER